MSRSRNDAYGRAFTLIELLVVVSIIALLIAILMPSLARARRQAQEVVCQSNLRQLAMGVTYYAQSHGGKIPPFRVSGKPKKVNQSKENIGWPQAIDRYIPTKCVERIGGREVYGDVHRCPNKRSNAEEGSPTAPIAGSYGLNAYLCSFVAWHLNDDKPNAVFDWVRMDQAKRPAEILLISESCLMIQAPVLPDPTDPGCRGAVVPRHRNLRNSNVAWMDGHVDSRESVLLTEPKQWWDLDWYPEKTYEKGFPAE